MSHGVKLVSLSVRDVGALTGRVDVGPFVGGVNVISGRNEAGKSTLVEALRAALFERHDAKNQKIKALQTHGTRNAPEVWVELDIGGERVSVHKRFIENKLAEVHLHREGTVVRGSEAEDLLLARLEGRRPGRTGGTRSDMGVWGLLWIAQDELAHADPGTALDDNTRGTLSDAIGRQVGQVLGGKHGERVRTRVLEQVGRYFRANTTATTAGEYRAAEDKLKDVGARVMRIELAKSTVENLAGEHKALGEQLREAGRRLPELEREHVEAVAAQQRVRELEGVRRETESALTAATAVFRAVQHEVEARAALTREAQQLGTEIEKGEDAAAELRRARLDAEGAATGSRDAADEARRVTVAAQAALDTATDDLDRARRRDDAARIARDLRAAEEVAGDVADAASRLEAEVLDEHTFEQLEGLAARAATLRARLDAEGTRIVVFSPEGEATVRSVGAPTTIEVPRLGVLDVEPARPGLSHALADVEKRRAKLAEALIALGVEDVPAARARHAVRVEAEREEEALRERMKRLAPEGLDALEQALRARRVTRVRLESALDEATRADREREESLRGLAENRLDEATMDGLRERERDVAVLCAACDAVATRVEVLALSDLRLRVQGGNVVHDLNAGERTALTSTLGTTLILDEIAEIRLEPRGEDLVKSRARLDRAERELTAALEALGIVTMADAAGAARAFSRLDATRRQAEERLAEAAPWGIAALRVEQERARAQGVADEADLVEARKALAGHARIEVDLAENRVTEDALARLVNLERELSDAEATIERLQARVRAVAGPVAAGRPRAWAVARAVRPDVLPGVVWEIIPGELGMGLDVDSLERRLREALERAGVADLGAAKMRFRAQLSLDARLAELRKQLKGLAPEGLEALRSRAVALGCADASSAAAGACEAVDLGALRTAVEERRDYARALSASALRASEAAERADREVRVLDGSLGEVTAVRAEKVTRLDVVTDKLAALRELTPDAALAQQGATARAHHEHAVAKARTAADELDAAAPHLLHGEVVRAEGAVASHRRAMAKLHDEALQRKALLDKASVEGHFEELTDARVEQLGAVEDLARIERQAGAARLLADVVESAYAESQRLFLAPVMKEAKPYLSRLRPGTELRMTRDLKLDKVLRHGEEEDFGQLSGGTREQLSVIVRLALARVLAKDERPLPLILDDTMGWTDDWRFLSMVQILRDAASELQIILLTCHPARFDRFQAEYAVDLDRLRDTSSPPLHAP